MTPACDSIWSHLLEYPDDGPHEIADAIQTYNLGQNGHFYFVFRSKTPPRANFFELFAKVFRSFRPRAICFDGATNFFNLSWHQRDSFGPKIVSIGAILAIFRPFEVSTTTTTTTKKIEKNEVRLK